MDSNTGIKVLNSCGIYWFLTVGSITNLMEMVLKRTADPCLRNYVSSQAGKSEDA
jgi:hypothetical protein